MAVFSTLRICEKTRLVKERRLPVPGEVMVKPGDVVFPDTVIARAEYVRGNPYVVDLSSEFGQRVDPELVDKVLLKKPGDRVRAKEVLARHQKNFWSEVIEVKSPCDGFIEYVSRTRGRIVIREDPRSAKPLIVVPVASKLGVWPRLIRMYTQVKEGDEVREGQVIAASPGVGTIDFVYAPMSGVVQKICSQTGTVTIVKPIKPTRVLAHMAGIVTRVLPDEGAVVEAEGAYIEGVFGIGGENSGELSVLSDGPGEVLDERGVGEDVSGKVVVAGALATLGAIQKVKEKGAVALIAGGLNQLDLVRLLGREINLGITGLEETGFTVIILEGFGKMPMNEKTWSILKGREGRVASVDGTTQIRAGVVRPEVIVSEGVTAESREYETGLPFPQGFFAEGYELHKTELMVGDRVRCIRPPYFGLWGTVEEMPEAPEKVECESVMEVARVRLDDGRLVTVAEANLEVFRDFDKWRGSFSCST
ncbi:MAG TPA: hypothetical protein GXX30_05145 [Firmicutes bacterium]|nr:hypothetical protein [Candidatus Fermentithermobacillaceae bacterium]